MSMDGVQKKRIIVTLVILIGLVFLFMYSITSDNPFGQALGDSESSANAWLDTNRNGGKDSGEPPLKAVCILSYVSEVSYNDSSSCKSTKFLTDSEGIWHGGEFFAGASCNGVYIYAYPPPGYEATTRVIVKNCNASFGFASLLSTSTH